MSVSWERCRLVAALIALTTLTAGCSAATTPTKPPSGERAAELPATTAVSTDVLKPTTDATGAPAVTPTRAAATVPATETATAQPSETPTEAATATSQPAAVASLPNRLVIDDISVDRELLAVGLDAQNIPIVPDHDVGWYSYSARPGQGENIVFWGHVLRFRNAPEIPAPFADLDDLPVGAELSIFTSDGMEHRYRVIQRVMATPDEVEYILPRGRELVTLVSCYGEQTIVDGSVEMSHRLITIAEPIDATD